MKSILRTVSVLVLLVACGDDGDDGGGGGSLVELEKDYNAEVDAVCARANECFQPGVEPGEEFWCEIPTRITDTGSSSIAFNTLGGHPCFDEVRTEHASGYRKLLECEQQVVRVFAEALEADECPETVPEPELPCEEELRAVNEEIEEALSACFAGQDG